MPLSLVSDRSEETNLAKSISSREIVQIVFAIEDLALACCGVLSPVRSFSSSSNIAKARPREVFSTGLILLIYHL